MEIDTKTLNQIKNSIHSEEKILANLYEQELTIVEIEELTKIPKRTLQYYLNPENNKSLTFCFYVERGSNNKYKISDKGAKKIQSMAESILIKEQKNKEAEFQQKKANRRNNKVLQQFIDYIDAKQCYDDENNTLVLKYTDIQKIDPQTALDLIDKPEEIIKLIKQALKEVVLEERDNVHIIFQDLKSIDKISPGKIRSKHIEKLVCVRGIVSQRKLIVSKAQEIVYCCPACGNQTRVIQHRKRTVEPKRCSVCAYKGKQDQLEENITDTQIIEIEDFGEDIGKRTQQVALKIYLKGEYLTSEEQQGIYNPGEMVSVIGVLRKEQNVSSKSKSPDFDKYLEAFNIEPNMALLDLTLKPEDKLKIEDMKKQAEKDFQPFLDSFAPHIVESDDLKIALLVAGVHNDIKGWNKRASPHVLMVGDPGQAKSQLTKALTDIIPRSRYAHGDSGLSGAGATASVVKDEENGWTLKAGAMVLANGSVCAIDELDKFPEIGKLHSVLESQEIQVSKAGIHATLKCKVSVVAGCNPRGGKFDDKTELHKQLGFKASLLSRFDLVFYLQDKIDVERDKRIVQSMFGTFKKEAHYDPNIMAKYLHVAGQIVPEINTDCMEYVSAWYSGLRHNLFNSGMSITPRFSDSCIRIASCFARLRLSETIDLLDFERATDLINKTIVSAQALPAETLQQINYGVSSRVYNIREKILAFCEDEIDYDLLLKKVDIEEEDLDKQIEYLINRGNIIETKRNKYLTVK